MESVSIKAQEAQDVLHIAVDRMRDLGAEFADARSQTVRVTGASTINGDLKQLVQKSTGGVCLRAWAGGRWGYGTATSFDREAVIRAAEEAAANAKGDGIPGLELEPSVVTGDHRAKVRIHPDSGTSRRRSRPLWTWTGPRPSTTASSTAPGHTPRRSRPTRSSTPPAPI